MATILPIAIVCVFLSPFFFFLATQFTVLQSISPQARKMHPALVWLQLIPVFGHVWQFIVVHRIADSFRAEIEQRLAGSFLDADHFQETVTMAKRPTLGKGITYAILNCIITLIILLSAIDPERMVGAMSAPLLILGLVTLICFITYWARLVAVKRLIKPIL